MARENFPYEFISVTEDEDALIKKYYKDYVRPFIRVGPFGHLSPPRYTDHAAQIYNIDVRPDDIWVTTFSRSGTTWLQEMIWLVANKLDYKTAKEISLTKRFAFIEFPTLDAEVSKPENPNKGGATEHDFRTLPSLPAPRYVKSHLPLSLLPPKLLDVAKVFYVVRNPLDVAVSVYFLHKLFRYIDESVPFAEFWQLFKKDLVFHMPISGHVEEARLKRDHPNLMFLFYQEMQNDLLDVIDRVCTFLGQDYTPAQKEELAKYLSFDNMKKNPEYQLMSADDSNTEVKFLRKGKSGDWINYFTGELRKEAEEYMEKYLSETDVQFPQVLKS